MLLPRGNWETISRSYDNRAAITPDLMSGDFEVHSFCYARRRTRSTKAVS